MKKPFKDTAVFKLLKTVAPAAKVLPFGIGSIVENITENNGTPEGQPDRNIQYHIIKLGVYAVLIYLVLSGKISWEDAESAKEFVN